MDNKGIVIIPSWYPTPAEPVSGIFVQQQAKALLEAGLNISIFFVEERRWPALSIAQYQLEENLPTFRLTTFVPPKRIKWLRFWWYQKWEQLLEMYVEEYGEYPRLLHAHSFVGGAAARYLSGKYGIPYLITEHYDGLVSGNIPAHWKGDLAGIYRYATKVIAVSPALAKGMSTYCSEVLMIPNMIDTALFYPMGVAAKNTNRQRIISVGSLTPRKNYKALIQVFARLAGQFSLELVIVGDGPMRQNLEVLASQLGLDQLVRFTGVLAPSDVANHLQSAQLYVSTSHSESFALAPVEALACGLPVVILRCGSILEYWSFDGVEVVDEIAGLEAGIRTRLKLLQKVEKQFLHEQVKAKFDAATIASQIRELYESIL